MNEFEKLKKAAQALYDAGYWHCDRPVKESELWENLRDAMNRKPGSAPEPLENN